MLAVMSFANMMHLHLLLAFVLLTQLPTIIPFSPPCARLARFHLERERSFFPFKNFFERPSFVQKELASSDSFGERVEDDNAKPRPQSATAATGIEGYTIHQHLRLHASFSFPYKNVMIFRHQNYLKYFRANTLKTGLRLSSRSPLQERSMCSLNRQTWINGWGQMRIPVV
jgi:hypothetical protein